MDKDCKMLWIEDVAYIIRQRANIPLGFCSLNVQMGKYFLGMENVESSIHTNVFLFTIIHNILKNRKILWHPLLEKGNKYSFHQSLQLWKRETTWIMCLCPLPDIRIVNIVRYHPTQPLAHIITHTRRCAHISIMTVFFWSILK